jgi:hypothetical protein
MPKPLVPLAPPFSSRGASGRRFTADRRSEPVTSIQQQVRAALSPSHLLFIHKAFADHLVYGRFDERHINLLDCQKVPRLCQPPYCSALQT